MENKQVINDRLKRILGQVQGIQRMVAADKPAQDILMQTKSVEAALWQLAVTMVHEEAANGNCQDPENLYELVSAVLCDFSYEFS